MEAPDLPGFDRIRLLGSGGYSDVFLYEQRMPRREVAIKVLLIESLGDAGRQQFYDEANAMAAVSTHPYIVTIFHADVSESGHPYLVMEYYPRSNFSVRARAEQIPVADVLRTGIHVASAVETAHRAGILHRDIKPANILTSEYNRPGLTDFGIATSGDGAEAEGMSIPWSPPEVVNGTAPGDVTADIYSLAATVYTLLAGRSPFEVVGGTNRSLDLVKRIEAGDPPPTGRQDVPPSLERVLRHGMSRSPLDRPRSAIEFARMLQAVELEQGWSATQLEIREEHHDVRSRQVGDEDDGTRLKGPVMIRSQSGASGPLVDSMPTRAESGTVAKSAPVHDGTIQRDSAAVQGGTVHRGDLEGVELGLIAGVGSRPVGLAGVAAPRPVRSMPSADVRNRPVPDVEVEPSVAVHRERPSGGWVVRAAIGVFVILALLVVIRLVVSRGTTDDRPVPRGTGTTVPNTLPNMAASRPRSPSSVTIGPSVDGEREVRWEHEGESPAEFTYLVEDVTGRSETVSVSGQTSARVPAAVNCVRVIALRGNGQGSSDEDDPSSFSDGC